MRKGVDGKKIATETVGARIPIEDVCLIKDNLDFFGCKDMTEFLCKIYQDKVKELKFMSIEGCKQLILEEEEKKRQSDIRTNKYNIQLQNLERENEKSMEEENMEMKDIPLSQGYIDEIKKQISELGMDEKIKNLVETIKDVESEEDKIKIEAVQEEIRKLSWERKEGAVSKIDFFRYIKFLKGGQNA
jgi:hypothetical protein